MVNVASTFPLDYPLPLKGDLEIRRKLYGASDPEGGVDGTTGEASVSGPEEVDSLRSRQ